MVEGLIGGFLDKFWLKPISFILLILINFLVVASSLPHSDNLDYTEFIIVCIANLVIDLFYLVALINHNKLPKAKNNELAILFVIEAESKKQFYDTQSKLVRNFEEIVSEGDQICFKVLYIQHHNIEKLDLSTHEKEKELLEKTNCIYLIRVRVMGDSIDNENSYEMTIDTGIIYRTYTNEAKQKFEDELKKVSVFSRRIKYEKKDKIQVLRMKAEQIGFVCRYIYGIACYFNGNFEQAEILCDNLFESINRIKANDPVRNILANVLPLKCNEIHLILASKKYIKYNETRDRKLLEQVHFHLEKANRYYPNTYGYYLIYAIYHVLNNRSIGKAKVCIDKCREIVPNGVWRYSQAFLSAYEGRSPLIIYRQYKKAFEIDYNILEIIEFIENIVEEEPEKNLLYFALALLYDEIDDKILMKENLEEFLKRAGLDNLDLQLVKILKERFSVRLEEIPDDIYSNID